MPFSVLLERLILIFMVRMLDRISFQENETFNIQQCFKLSGVMSALGVISLGGRIVLEL